MIKKFKNFICKIFNIKQCACSDQDEVGQKGLPIINRKLDKINKKHNKDIE
jgi:hypothetical protein